MADGKGAPPAPPHSASMETADARVARLPASGSVPQPPVPLAQPQVMGLPNPARAQVKGTGSLFPQKAPSALPPFAARPPHHQRPAAQALPSTHQQPAPLQQRPAMQQVPSTQQRPAPGQQRPAGQPPPSTQQQPATQPSSTQQRAAQQPQPASKHVLSLPQLRQMFFDQPLELGALQQRLEGLYDLRRKLQWPAGKSLWDFMLPQLGRYHQLLQQQQGAPGGIAAFAALKLSCDLCHKSATSGQLRRMQAVGAMNHMAVCGACAEMKRGSLVPLTDTWQPDMNAWLAIQQQLFAQQKQQQQQSQQQQHALQQQQLAPRPQQQAPMQQQSHPPPLQRRPSGGSKGRAASAPAPAARPGSAASSGSNRGRARFQGTSRAWLKELTKANLDPSTGPKPRIYLPFSVYWFWVDRLLGEAALHEHPRVLRLVLPAPGPAAPSPTAAPLADGTESSAGAAAASLPAIETPSFDIPLLNTDDGWQLQPNSLRPLLARLNPHVGCRLLVELQAEQCSIERLQATVRLIGSTEPLPDLPGDPVTAPVSQAAAAGLGSCKKRKGTGAKGGGGGADEEVYGWNEEWDDADDDPAVQALVAAQSIDGPSGAGRSKRRGAGGRLASILRRELPQQDDLEDGDFDAEGAVVAQEDWEAVEEAGEFGSGGDGGDGGGGASGGLRFTPRRTSSIEAATALSAHLAADVEILGACPPPPGTAQKWNVQARCPGFRKAWFGRIDRQRAAVAADLAAVWQQAYLERRAEARPQPVRHLSLKELLALERGEAVQAAPTNSGGSDGSRGEGAGRQRTGGGGTAWEAVPEAVLNLPGARYHEDAELMEQLRQVRSTEQMTAFLAGVIPQDRRRATGPSAALYSPPVQQQQARQGAAGGSQQAQAGNSPGPGQHPLSPPLHKQQSHRKRKRAATGRPPLAGPPQASGDGSGRRRVGVVFNGEEGRWTAAAAGRDAAGQLVALRVEGLPTPDQAEVARDLLALWGWLAQGGVMPADPQQQQQQQQQQPEAAATTAAISAAGGPPVPPLNHPLEFYSQWAPDLRTLGGRHVEPYVQVVAAEVSGQLPAPRGSPGQTTAAATTPPPSQPHAGRSTAKAARTAGPAMAGGGRAAGAGAPSRSSSGAVDMLEVLAHAASASLGPAEEAEQEPDEQQPAAEASNAAASVPPGHEGGLAADQKQAPEQLSAEGAPPHAPRLQHQLSVAGESELGRESQLGAPAQQSTGEAAVPGPEATSPASRQLLAGGGSGSGSLLGAAGSDLAGASAALAGRAAAAAQRKVQQALEAFEAASSDSSDSMLRPLRLLTLGGKGGETLRTIVRNWSSYSEAQQQEVFEAALIASSEGSWQGLEEQVRLALEL